MKPQIYGNILETIGQTPMVKLNRITKDSPHQFFAKMEYFNPAGSIKDRIGLAMIEAAEKRGDV
ncbi:MAG: pyridoxal-phosphate dependent enzyme, partial [Bdellovibrionaceae bacterium]|nr:pyridoxal-phosphate dependent enzyme [Pseudobdellovibrionaceae bacterium]